MHAQLTRRYGASQEAHWEEEEDMWPQERRHRIWVSGTWAVWLPDTALTSNGWLSWADGGAGSSPGMRVPHLLPPVTERGRETDPERHGPALGEMGLPRFAGGGGDPALLPCSRQGEEGAGGGNRPRREAREEKKA